MTKRTCVFDGYVLRCGPLTGVARSFLWALEAFAARGETRSILAMPPGPSMPELEQVAAAGVEVIGTTAAAGPIRRQATLPAFLRRVGADLLHVPVAAIPMRAPCPVIATIHDLPWHAEPDARGDLRGEPGCGASTRIVTRVATKRAQAVIVPSEATRADVVSEAGARCVPIHVVPLGVPLPSAAGRGRDGGCFLYLGDARPRKNLPRLSRAHERARATRPDLPDLVHVGPGGSRYLSEAEKANAIRNACAVVLVSLHEGFGLPVLEAFGHGTPVLCSPRKSLRELAGDAALVVDPTDERAIAEGLVRIHADRGLRADLSRRGRLRAEERTPDRTAAGWDRVHAEVLR
ncbi:MAG: glycosyltransferase family 1 protein [Planctomycetota bacterium]|nr:glycosyltransferase family 1 protein [Planctomycetota bacterium]MDA0932088.1 glycosyltransferase family 1 protein [Planctomycetota bacterium]MDA1223179.1 glycosyltransferase family 1 protein [Planctomycetota bacterium]